MKTYHLPARDFAAALVLARDVLDFPEDDFDLEPIAEMAQTHTGEHIDPADWYDVIDATDWRIEIDASGEDVEILPLPTPGSWYDPAFDPSNADIGPSIGNMDDAVIVMLRPSEAELLCAWLKHQEARDVKRSPAMAAAIADLRLQLTPWQAHSER